MARGSYSTPQLLWLTFSYYEHNLPESLDFGCRRFPLLSTLEGLQPNTVPDWPGGEAMPTVSGNNPSILL